MDAGAVAIGRQVVARPFDNTRVHRDRDDELDLTRRETRFPDVHNADLPPTPRTWPGTAECCSAPETIRAVRNAMALKML